MNQAERIQAIREMASAEDFMRFAFALDMLSGGVPRDVVLGEIRRIQANVLEAVATWCEAQVCDDPFETEDVAFLEVANQARKMKP